MSSFDCDLCVIGGGINGAGIARDAAGRGLSVVLLEQSDLAGATSSASSKLIHGGLRYLEYYEFQLVRDSLKERERLLCQAPHIIYPMEFVLPHEKGQRPYWMLRAGLFLYDHLAPRRKLPKSKCLSLQSCLYGAPLQSRFHKGFSYADCWVDDSRLVVLNALDAAQKGAKILTRTKSISIKEAGGGWYIETQNQITGEVGALHSKMLVNAAGPWVREIIEEAGLETSSTPLVRLVKGSHIVVKRAFEGEHAYILQQPDKRIVFVLPYEGDYRLIGTTEENFTGNPADVQISQDEIKYLISAFNNAFENQISQKDVLWSYSGVRPLFDDGESDMRSVTRDYRIHIHKKPRAPLISVFGGKITTYRILSRKVVNRLLRLVGEVPKAWTDSDDVTLPGGDMTGADFAAFIEAQKKHYSWIPNKMLQRYARSYGTRMDFIIGDASSLEGLGLHFGNDLYEAEVKYLLQYEFAYTAQDILWRRSKLGLHVSDKTVANLEYFLQKESAQ